MSVYSEDILGALEASPEAPEPESYPRPSQPPMLAAGGRFDPTKVLSGLFHDAAYLVQSTFEIAATPQDVLFGMLRGKTRRLSRRE